MIPNLRSSTLLDRQSHKRADDEYITGLAVRADARVIVLVDHKPVITSNDERTEAGLRWFTSEEVDLAGLAFKGALFLGIDRETGAGRFALALSEFQIKSSPAAIALLRPAVDLRTLAMQGVMTAEELSLAGQAKALTHWHDSARCCGRCGGLMRAKDSGWKRRCWACGSELFPRTDPVVIMLIEHPDRKSCLLGRSGRFAANMFSTLAGFVEPGEDVADAVRRESMEEAGVEIGNVVFHSAQPWPFPHSLMIGCIGYSTTSKLTIDEEEIVEARWFPREEARSMLDGTHPGGLFGPGRQAIARALITAFVEGRT
jgi:NAD+ diphosphatase